MCVVTFAVDVLAQFTRYFVTFWDNVDQLLIYSRISIYSTYWAVFVNSLHRSILFREFRQIFERPIGFSKPLFVVLLNFIVKDFIKKIPFSLMTFEIIIYCFTISTPDDKLKLKWPLITSHGFKLVTAGILYANKAKFILDFKWSFLYSGWYFKSFIMFNFDWHRSINSFYSGCWELIKWIFTL